MFLSLVGKRVLLPSFTCAFKVVNFVTPRNIPSACFSRPSISIARSFPTKMNFQLNQTRLMNRNARRPKKANHGKRPCSHARRRARAQQIKSRAHREKIFGFW